MLVLKRDTLTRCHHPDYADIVLREPGRKPIIVTILEIQDGRVKVGIKAAPEVKVWRGELDAAASQEGATV